MKGINIRRRNVSCTVALRRVRSKAIKRKVMSGEINGQLVKATVVNQEVVTE